jgi:hypothetical protein
MRFLGSKYSTVDGRNEVPLRCGIQLQDKRKVKGGESGIYILSRTLVNIYQYTM